jgi:hypothetical protein
MPRPRSCWCASPKGGAERAPTARAAGGALEAPPRCAFHPRRGRACHPMTPSAGEPSASSHGALDRGLPLVRPSNAQKPGGCELPERQLCPEAHLPRPEEGDQALPAEPFGRVCGVWRRFVANPVDAWKWIRTRSALHGEPHACDRRITAKGLTTSADRPRETPAAQSIPGLMEVSREAHEGHDPLNLPREAGPGPQGNTTNGDGIVFWARGIVPSESATGLVVWTGDAHSTVWRMVVAPTGGCGDWGGGASWGSAVAWGAEPAIQKQGWDPWRPRQTESLAGLPRFRSLTA